MYHTHVPYKRIMEMRKLQSELQCLLGFLHLTKADVGLTVLSSLQPSLQARHRNPNHNHHNHDEIISNRNHTENSRTNLLSRRLSALSESFMFFFVYPEIWYDILRQVTAASFRIFTESTYTAVPHSKLYDPIHGLEIAC